MEKQLAKQGVKPADKAVYRWVRDRGVPMHLEHEVVIALKAIGCLRVDALTLRTISDAIGGRNGHFSQRTSRIANHRIFSKVFGGVGRRKP